MIHIKNATLEDERLVLLLSGVSLRDLEDITTAAGYKHRELTKRRVGGTSLEVISGRNVVAHATGVHDFSGSATLTITSSAVARTLWEAIKKDTPDAEMADAPQLEFIKEYLDGNHDHPFGKVKGVGMSPLHWIWIIPLLAIIIAGTVAVVKNVGDHYTRRSLSRVVAQAATPYVEQGTLEKLLSPDFSDLSLFEPERFDYLSDEVGITEGYLIRVPKLREYLQQASRSGTHLQMKINTRDGFHIDALVIGSETVATDLTMGIVPVTLGEVPPVTPDGAEGTYRNDEGIAYDKKTSFLPVERMTAKGMMTIEAGEYVLVMPDYKVAFDGKFTQGFRMFLDHIMPMGEEITVFFTFTEKFEEWQDRRRQPQRRKATKQIGYVHVDGIQFGGIYIENE